MRLKPEPLGDSKHSEFVSAVGWSSPDELFSAADDGKVLKWNVSQGDTVCVHSLPENLFPTDLHWFPRTQQGAGRKIGTDIFLLATSDGKFHFVTKTGRIEKSQEAHRGSVLSSKWAPDSNGIATCGEDGAVKLWSRSGMLRSTLSQNSSPVYALAWSPDSDQVLFCCSRLLYIRPCQPQGRSHQWKAHDGLVLTVDWNAVNKLIVSGGEDCKYRVWDSYGVQLFCSQVNDFPITSVSWTPDGQLFAVGSHNLLRLCDKLGWSYGLEKPETGGVARLVWSADGTQLAGACGNGQVLFANLVDRRLDWRNFEALVVDKNLIEIRNVANDSLERLDFRDRVVKTALGFDHLLVTTATQCLVYSSRNWNTPTIFDLKDSAGVNMLLLAEKHFLLCDQASLHVYSYEGRLISSPKIPNLHPETLNELSVSLSSDTLAVRDGADEKQVHFFDTQSNKPLNDGKPFRHTMEVLQLALDQRGPPSERRLALIDVNRDLHIARVRVFGTVSHRSVKLGSMIQWIRWNDAANILAALSDSRFKVWFYPNAVFSDADLLPLTLFERDASAELGKSPVLQSYVGNYAFVQRSDGAVVPLMVSPYPARLHALTLAARWDDAVRLCRFVKERTLWACLAAMAATDKNLTTAETAYAAIDASDKVRFLSELRHIIRKEVRAAEMALFCGRPAEAEGTLLAAGLVFRAIQLNMDQFNWDRALDLAVKHKTHVDTVLAHRKRYLEASERKETDKRFQQLSAEIDLDWEKIQQKVQLEYETERSK